MQVAVYWPRVDIQGLPAELHGSVYEHLRPHLAFAALNTICCYPSNYVLVGHKKPVLSVCFGASEKELYSASRDLTIRVWNNYLCIKKILLNDLVWNLQWHDLTKLKSMKYSIRQRPVEFITPSYDCNESALAEIIANFDSYDFHMTINHALVFKNTFVTVGTFRVHIFRLDDVTYKRRIFLASQRGMQGVMSVMDENYIYALSTNEQESNIYVCNHRGITIKNIFLPVSIMRISLGPTNKTLLGFLPYHYNAYYIIDVRTGEFGLR